MSYIDNAGKVLLKEMHGQGGELIAEGCLNQAIVNEIVGPSDKAESAEKKSEAGRRELPSFSMSLLSPAGYSCGPARQTQSQAPPNKSVLAPVSPTDVQRLTLEQAVALALKQNPTQQIAVLNVAESVQEKNITRSELLPKPALRSPIPPTG